MPEAQSPFPIAPGTRVYIAGHRGLAGSAAWRAFEARGGCQLIGVGSDELDLRDRSATRSFFADQRPDVVIDAAARVGGIAANDSMPADFLSDNLRIQLNVIDAAAEFGTERLLFLASSCMYPKHADQPITEEAILTGPLEPTNDAYAIAKLAGTLHVQAMRRQHGLRYITAVPTNLYGPGDNFDPSTSHVLPALVRRFCDAMASGTGTVTLWGTGSPRREFLHADDLGSACLQLLEGWDDPRPVNVGFGSDIEIRELATMIASATGFSGSISWDATKPDGTPRKLLDSSRIRALGWEPKVDLEAGIAETVGWYREHSLPAG